MKKFIWRDESWNPVTSKVDKEPSVSRTQSNLQERDLSESSQWPRAVNYLRKELYVRRSTGFWIRLWPRTQTHWVNILIQVTQLFIENIVPNFEKPSTNDMRNKRIPTKNELLKVSNREKCKTRSNSTVKTTERRHSCGCHWHLQAVR